MVHIGNPGSLTSLQQTGGRLIRHARYYILQLAESHLTQSLFWADSRAYRATRVAPDLIASTAHGGCETRSRIDPGGGGSEVGGRGWQASEHAVSAGQAPREGPLSPIPHGRNRWFEGARLAQQPKRAENMGPYRKFRLKSGVRRKNI